MVDCIGVVALDLLEQLFGLLLLAGCLVVMGEVEASVVAERANGRNGDDAMEPQISQITQRSWRPFGAT